MQPDIVPSRPEQRVLLPSKVVRQNCAAIQAQEPDLIGYDATTDQGELIGLRVATDAGVPQSQKDGYRGTLVAWGIAPFEAKGDKDGEVFTYLSLALLFESGDLVRLSGEPAIKTFLNLIRAAGKERCQLGIKIKIKRRPSGTSGRSYWTVLPDA